MRLVAVLLILSACELTGSRVQAQTDPVSEAKRLRDAGDFAAAARTLEPYLRQYPNNAGVHWLHAQLSFWSVDYLAARTSYERALAITTGDDILRIDYARFLVATGRYARAMAVLRAIADPARAAESAVLQQQILHATSPWTRITAEGHSDNQPLRGIGADVEAGFFAHPTVTLAARARLHNFASDSLEEGNTVTGAGAALSWSPEGSRFSLRGIFGIERGSIRTIATPQATASLRVARETFLRADVERLVYRETLASMDTMVAVRRVELALDRAATRGFAGKAAFRAETFPDDNRVTSLSVWALVPVHHHVRVGVAASRQDAEESRWSGTRYSPYYTPANVSAVSALGELYVPFGASIVQVNASYAIAASEDEPLAGTTAPVLFERVSFTPWTVAGTLATPLATRTTLTIRAEHQATAFYHASRVYMTILWLAR